MTARADHVYAEIWFRPAQGAPSALRCFDEYQYINPVPAHHLEAVLTTGIFLSEHDSDEVLASQDGPVGILTIDRPEAMNTISPEVERALHAALDRAVADDSVRAIVLTGAGDRAFSAGYDISDHADFASRAEELRYAWQVNTAIGDYHWHILSLEKPVIAAVRGWALAGAFWYTLACDITIAGDDAVFAQPEIRETNNSTTLLPFLVGWKNAARYALTGDHFDAQEALRLGIVSEVVPADEVLERAVALGKRIAMVPADSVRLNKRIITASLEAAGVRSALDSTGYLSTIIHLSADHSPELEEFYAVRERDGLAASLKVRDGKFRPEPGGPRSR